MVEPSIPAEQVHMLLPISCGWLWMVTAQVRIDDNCQDPGSRHMCCLLQLAGANGQQDSSPHHGKGCRGPYHHRLTAARQSVDAGGAGHLLNASRNSPDIDRPPKRQATCILGGWSIWQQTASFRADQDSSAVEDQHVQGNGNHTRATGKV